MADNLTGDTRSLSVISPREFCAVAVMATDDEISPSQERVENVADDAYLEELLRQRKQERVEHFGLAGGALKLRSFWTVG
jgi:hypothetical protein